MKISTRDPPTFLNCYVTALHCTIICSSNTAWEKAYAKTQTQQPPPPIASLPETSSFSEHVENISRRYILRFSNNVRSMMLGNSCLECQRIPLKCRKNEYILLRVDILVLLMMSTSKSFTMSHSHVIICGWMRIEMNIC